MSKENEVKKDQNLEEEIVENEIDSKEEIQEEVVVSDEEKFASLDEEYKIKMENLVADANEKAKDSEDKYLRTHADFENIKKRLEKEKYSAIDYASEKFAKDLLAPIDAMQMALLSSNADIPAEDLVEKLKEGFNLTIKAFNTAFEKHDIIEVEYEEFNPEYHNAVQKVDSEDIDSGNIVMVMQKGYKFKDRLLREAMVSIAN